MADMRDIYVYSNSKIANRDKKCQGLEDKELRTQKKRRSLIARSKGIVEAHNFLEQKLSTLLDKTSD